MGSQPSAFDDLADLSAVGTARNENRANQTCVVRIRFTQSEYTPTKPFRGLDLSKTGGIRNLLCFQGKRRLVCEARLNIRVANPSPQSIRYEYAKDRRVSPHVFVEAILKPSHRSSTWLKASRYPHSTALNAASNRSDRRNICFPNTPTRPTDSAGQ